MKELTEKQKTALNRGQNRRALFGARGLLNGLLHTNALITGEEKKHIQAALSHLNEVAKMWDVNAAQFGLVNRTEKYLKEFFNNVK